MTVENLIILVFIIALIGSLPNWTYSRGWGYGPSGAVLLLAILILVWFMYGNRDVRDVGRDAGTDLKQMGDQVQQDLEKAGREIRNDINSTR